MPVPRPPFPAVSGLWGKPTVINNVETWRTSRSSSCGAATGSRRSARRRRTGTKVFALTGKINNSGLIEVPMGITLREIIFDIGGGIRDGKDVQGRADRRAFGRRHHRGLSRHADRLRAPAAAGLDHGLGRHDRHGRGRLHGGRRPVLPGLLRRRELRQVRAVPDRRRGRCCNLLEKITEGKGTLEDLDKIREVGHAMQKAALCGLGQTAPNPVLSTLQVLRGRVRAHIDEKRCPAGKCKSLVDLRDRRGQVHRLHAVRAPVPGEPHRGRAAEAARDRSRRTASSAASASRRASSAP